MSEKRIAPGTRYESADRLPGKPGWVGIFRGTITKKDGTKVHSVSWWFGPDHGWGTTSGPLGPSVAVFSSKKKCEDAIRSVYGVASGMTARVTAQRVADAEAEQERRLSASRKAACA